MLPAQAILVRMLPCTASMCRRWVSLFGNFLLYGGGHEVGARVLSIACFGSVPCFVVAYRFPIDCVYACTPYSMPTEQET